jgi:DNA invertase Pin-like site-specific DNA recombinase
MDKGIAGYVRVSDQKLKTDGERRQDIERQKIKIKKFCESMGWSEPIFFCDDGISAFKDDYNNRPNFVKLLNEIRANRIKRVIVEDLTRWSRRVEDGLKTMREASEKCTITSLAEGEIDNTLPEGWFKTAVSFLLAEWSSRTTSYKVSSGMDKLRNDKNKICESCGVVHLGRHPNTCECSSCKKKRVGREYYKKTKLNRVAIEG